MRLHNTFPAAVFLLAPLVLNGQTAELSGRVNDPSGAVISSARVKLVRHSTGSVRNGLTNEAGLFTFAGLHPDHYDLEFNAAGFSVHSIKGVQLDVNERAGIDVTLRVGDVSDTVVVTADASTVRARDTASSYTVTAQEVARLPVGGSRNYTRLVLLMPGTSSISRSQANGTISGTALYSVNGQRPQDNNYMLDGIENNLMHQSSPGGSPPLDSMQEFRIATNASAEAGRSVGANVSVVTRSGTNTLHGSLYEFLRNDKLDANDFFANRQGQGKVPFRQNLFGASAGGPVYVPKLYDGRNKSFWFVNYEGHRRRRGSTLFGTFPTQAQRVGDFNETGRTIYDPLTSDLDSQGRIVRQPFAGNRIPTSRVNPASRYWIDTLVPLPNLPGLTQNFMNTRPQRNDRNTVVARFDHQFSERDSIMVRYLDQNAEQATPQAHPLLFGRSTYDVRNLGASWTRVLSPTSLIDVRFGYHIPYPANVTKNELGISRNAFLEKSGVKLFQRDTPYNPIPALNLRGEFAISEGGGAVRDDVFQFITNFSKQAGVHALKVGANINRRLYTKDAANPMNGQALFDQRLTQTATDSRSGAAMASFLLGYPSEVTRGEGLAQLDARQTSWQVYAQDEWRMNPWFNINFGVRYEFQKPAYDLFDRLGTILVERDAQSGRYSGSLLWAGTNPLAGNSPPNRRGYGRGLQVTDFNNFAPRLGISVQLPQGILLRSAFGMFYNSSFMQEAQDKNKFYPYSTSQFFTANTGTKPDLAITDPGPGFQNTEAIGGWPQNPNNLTPYSNQWNLSLQKVLPTDVTLMLAYVGASNRRQIGYAPFNTAPIPGPGPIQPRRLLPEFGDIQYGNNDYKSNYNALQVTAVRGFRHGLQLNANYTWGRSMDDQSSLAETRTQNPFDRRADYSRSSFDVRHVFQTSFVFDAPFGRGRRYGAGVNRVADTIIGGWSIEGIIRFQTGAAVNVLSGLDRANVGQSSQRPNVLRNPNDGPRTPDEWFDTKAFVQTAPFTFGNAGAFIVQADGRRSVDISLFKRFVIREGHSLAVRGELYNLPNLVSFGDPNATLTSTSFGRITSASDARQIQLALRYSF